MEDNKKTQEELKREEAQNAGADAPATDETATEKTPANRDTQAYAEGLRKGQKKAIDELLQALNVANIDELKAKINGPKEEEKTESTETQESPKIAPGSTDAGGSNEKTSPEQNANVSEETSQSEQKNAQNSDLMEKNQNDIKTPQDLTIEEQIKALKEENAALKAEKIATTLVAGQYASDLVAICKGRGLEITAENLKAVADTHPEWAPKATASVPNIGTNSGTKNGPGKEDGLSYARRLLGL